MSSGLKFNEKMLALDICNAAVYTFPCACMAMKRGRETQYNWPNNYR